MAGRKSCKYTEQLQAVMDKTKKDIILIGGGGHCKSCIEVLESTNKYNIIGILDLPSELGKKVLDYEVIGNDDDYEKFKTQGCSFLVTAGQIKSAKLRKQIFDQLVELGADIATVIADSSRVSKYATIGRGTILMHNSFVNAGVEIGENCIINTGAVVEHDVKVEQHSHISTTAVINGDCRVGEEVFIGSGSCISNGIVIGDQVVIGAGSTVTNNITAAGIFVGSPAKKI